MDPAQTTGARPPPELLELAELRSQLARYRAAFELSVPGQALIGLTGRFLEANASLCQILGYSQAELQSRRFRYITRPAISEQRLSISPQGKGAVSAQDAVAKWDHACRMGCGGLHRQAGGTGPATSRASHPLPRRIRPECKPACAARRPRGRGGSGRGRCGASGRQRPRRAAQPRA